MKGGSIRTRLRNALGAVAMLVFTVVGGALYLTLSSELARTEQATLRSKADVLRAYIERTGPQIGVAELRDQIERMLMVDDSGLRVWLLSGPKVLLGHGALPEEVETSDGILRLRDQDGVSMDGRRMAVTGGNGHYDTLVVALDTQRRESLLHTYMWLIVIACGAGVVASVVLTDLATRHGLAPLRRISRKAASVVSPVLIQPLEFGRVDAEIADLVSSLNVASTRVSNTYRQMEAFNADVAHELRTPVACMISNAQVTLAEERPVEELREALLDQLESLERMKGMINDMLFLARADLGEAAQDARPAELGEEVASTVEFYEALLDESGLTAEVDGEARVRCNPGLIRRAVSNLLSNAIGHTARGETIRIEVRREGKDALVEVFNPGAPLSDEMRSRMFDRFYRADESRGRGGHGLGLAIVRAVAMMHGGSGYALYDPKGARIGIRIPVEPPAPPPTAAEAQAPGPTARVSAGASGG